MTELLVDIEYTPPLAIIYLNRPEVLNAYNQSLLDIFEKKMQELLDDEKIDAVIITGKGRKAFTVGADIDWLEQLDSERAEEISRQGQRICNLIEQTPKVVIAAINGYALGGGLEIALACDLRLASTRARFGQPEVRLGIVPGFDGTQRLPELIGVGRAKEIMFTGEIFDASQAYEIGLVNKVVTPRDLLDASKDLAHEISEQSSQAVALIKDVINYNCNTKKDKKSEYETKAFGACFKDEEHLKRIHKIQEMISNNS
ncbi:MAG: enoyl-CoA hydratase/isomerase family protein [Bacillota bacterium]